MIILYAQFDWVNSTSQLLMTNQKLNTLIRYKWECKSAVYTVQSTNEIIYEGVGSLTHEFSVPTRLRFFLSKTFVTILNIKSLFFRVITLDYYSVVRH